jgi:hypothetical protein
LSEVRAKIDRHDDGVSIGHLVEGHSARNLRGITERTIGMSELRNLREENRVRTCMANTNLFRANLLDPVLANADLSIANLIGARLPEVQKP